MRYDAMLKLTRVNEVNHQVWFFVLEVVSGQDENKNKSLNYPILTQILLTTRFRTAIPRMSNSYGGTMTTKNQNLCRRNPAKESTPKSIPSSLFPPTQKQPMNSREADRLQSHRELEIETLSPCTNLSSVENSDGLLSSRENFVGDGEEDRECEM